MKAETQRTALIGLGVLIAWLLYQIVIEIKRVIVIEERVGNGIEDTGRDSDSQSKTRPSPSKEPIQLKPAI